ncbi:MAG: ABC transporter ATP-binding protein, partial [Lentisphaeria bacterium]
ILVKTEEQLIVIDEQETVQTQVPFEQVASIYCRNLVGNGILEAIGKDHSRTDLLRYSQTLAEPFAQLAQRLNQELGLGEEEQQEQEEEATKASGGKHEHKHARCPKCGHPLQHLSDPCPHCTNKKRILSRLIGYLFRHKRLLFLGSLTSLAAVGINLSPPILIRLLIDKALTPTDLPEAVRLQRVYILVGIFLVLILIRVAVQYVRIRTMSQLGAKVVMDLRRDLFRSLQRLSLSYYDTNHTGRIMSRVLNDTRHVQQFVVGGLQQAGIHTLMVIGIPIIMLQQNWHLALIALAPIPIAAYLGKFFSGRYKTAFRKLKRRVATLSAAVSDAVSGIRVVKSFSQEERETVRFDQKATDIYHAHLSAAETRALFNPTVIFVMTFGSLIVWLLGGRWIVLGVGTLTTGMLVQFISYMNQLRAPVQQLIQLTEVFQQSATSAERVFNIMDMPSEVGDHPDSRDLKNIQGQIEFRDVSFKYKDGERVLKNISFNLEPGKMLGLVGETGSGKSTLASLVCRFYDPTQGQVLVDGIDLRDIKVQSLREHIGMVLQSTFLFAGTIRDNLVYGKPEASERDIVEAAKAANAHEFIMHLPDGYDSQVGERGSGLSGGEKQRIAIARAILKNPDILILDEATSAVDTATEQAIQEAMDRLIAGRTTIAIAHRLSTLRNADKLLVLEHGEILEKGTHRELLEKNGRYAKLCRIQAEFAEYLES